MIFHINFEYAILDSELEEIVSIIGDMSFRYWNEEDAHGKTLEKYYNKYGYAVYSEIADAHRYLKDKADYALAERTVKKYTPCKTNTYHLYCNRS